MSFVEPKLSFKYFKPYAAFLLANIERLSDEYLKYTEEIKPEWIALCTSRAEFRESSKNRLTNFFNSVLNDNAVEKSIENIIYWNEKQSAGFDTQSLSTSDILLSFSIRRLTNLSLIEEYTTDLAVAKKVFEETERFYSYITQCTIDVYINKHLNTLNQVNEDLSSNKEELKTINEELIENQEALQRLNQELQAQIEEKNLVEKALRENKSRYKALAENLEDAQSISHVGSWEYDLETSKVFWSAELFRIFGYEPNEIELNYQKYLDHLHPSYLETVVTTIESTITTKEPYTLEHKILTRQGREKWILGKGKVVLSDDGKVIRLKGVVSDITTAKLYEIKILEKNQEMSQLLEELKSAEEHLTTLNTELENRVKERTNELAIVNDIGKSISSELDLSKVVQKVTDVTTSLSGAEFGAFFYTVKNDNNELLTLYTISGVEREKFSKFPMPRKTQIFSPTFNAEGIVRIDDITKDPRYGHNPPYHGMPEGHLPVKSYLAVPVVSRTGEVLGGLFYGHSKAGIFKSKVESIVEAIASQAAIAIDNARLYENSRKDQQKLKKLLESMPTIAWTSDPVGDIDYFNDHFYHFTGKDFESSKGRKWFDVVHPEDHLSFSQEWEQRVLKGSEFEMEFRIKGSNGAYQWQLCRAVPLLGENNSIIKWFGTCTNIQEQKETNEKLIDTNKELIKINEFLDTFVYIAAHDLRSPLSNLKMILTLLQRTQDPDKKQEFLNSLNISVNKLDQTVNGLVKIIEIQSTDTSMVRSIDFNEVFNNVAEDYLSAIAEKQVVLKTDFSANPSIVYIEAYLISIIKNIIGNSIKYHSPYRQPVIELTTEKADGFTLLKVSDNGVGMDLTKYGKNIFKPFTRFSKIADGKGLGLYLVKNMVEKNGGKIVVESVLGSGTTFNIYLKDYYGEVVI